MTNLDLIDLANKLSTREQERKKAEALRPLDTGDQQRDAYWRTLGKKIRKSPTTTGHSV